MFLGGGERLCDVIVYLGRGWHVLSLSRVRGRKEQREERRAIDGLGNDGGDTGEKMLVKRRRREGEEEKSRGD